MKQEGDSSSVVEELFAPLVAQRLAGVVVGITHPQGRLVRSFGESGTGRTLGEDTIFEIGSITKVFTALLLADMSTRGEVTLDDPVGNYLPERVKTPGKSGREITLLDLATHTSGLPRVPLNLLPHVVRNRANPYANYSYDELYGAVEKARVKRSIGTKVRYSNLGFGLLGHVLERAAGRSYEELVVDRVCRPLEMSDTGNKVASEAKGRLAQGHKGRKPVGGWDLPTLAGAGALRSTAIDQLHFVEAHLHPERTPLANALRLALEPRRQIRRGKVDICLAWLRTKTKAGRWVTWHNGGTGGFASFVGFDAAGGMGLVVLSNSRMTMKLNATSMRLLDRVGESFHGVE